MKKTISPGQRRGSALILIIVATVVLTGLVMAITWAGGTQSQTTSASIHLDQAAVAAESAGQLAVWQFKHDNSWRQAVLPGTLPTVSIGANVFTMATTCTDAGAVATLYWPFSEGTGVTTADVSGHNNTGNFNGAVTWVPGRYGEGLQFDGQTAYIDAGSGPSTNISGAVTMAAWIKMNSAAQDQKPGGNQDGIAGGYKMSIYGLKSEFEVRDAQNTWWGTRPVSGGTILATDVWYHLAGTYDGNSGTMCSYVNGVLDRKATGYPANALAPTNGTFQMGREPWVVGGNNRYFNGTMDDVRIYNRALSAQEIRTLANTSVHIHSLVAQQNSVSSHTVAAVDFICSAPTPLAPIAPALTVGGNLVMANNSISGDVQCAGTITVNSASSVNGHVTYGSSFSDPSHLLTLTYQGNSAAPSQQASTPPTINYAWVNSLAVTTYNGGTNQTITFNAVNNGAEVCVVNGDCTDPVVDTSNTSGTLLITGNLYITKSATWGAAGLPAYIIVQGNVTQSAALNLTGALYVGGNWVHTDATISGDICVAGDVTDNTVTASTFVVSTIPWFDPRANATPVAQSLFYAAYQGANP